MNQINHINHLAALQVQQRMIDPRIQPLRTVIPSVSPGTPLSSLSPRSVTAQIPGGVPGLVNPPISSTAAMNTVLKRALSTAVPIFSSSGKPGK